MNDQVQNIYMQRSIRKKISGGSNLRIHCLNPVVVSPVLAVENQWIPQLQPEKDVTLYESKFSGLNSTG